MTSDNGGPAFPACNDANMNDTMGMPLRDYFAAHAPDAPPGFHSRDRIEFDTDTEWHVERLTAWRYLYADAMLAARNKEASDD